MSTKNPQRILLDNLDKIKEQEIGRMSFKILPPLTDEETEKIMEKYKVDPKKKNEKVFEPPKFHSSSLSGLLPLPETKKQTQKSTFKPKLPNENDDPRWKGERVSDGRGGTYIQNNHIKGACKRAVYGGRHPRSHCNSPVYKNSRCQYHHRQYMKQNPFI